MRFPSYNISPEREKELIDKLATFVIDRHMETPAVLLLESYKPLSFIAGQFGMAYLSPLMPLFGPWSKEGFALLQRRENVEKLIRRIEELSEERKGKK